MQLLVNIDVDDLDRAIAFYTRALGLDIGRRFGDDCVELLGGNAPIYLLKKAAGTRATSAADDVRNYSRHWSPVHLDFVVDDIEEAHRRAVEAGAVAEAPIRTSTWGRLALMSDPFGHGFCLVQFLGRGYDEIATA